jgi:hypothetical protein
MGKIIALVLLCLVAGCSKRGVARGLQHFAKSGRDREQRSERKSDCRWNPYNGPGGAWECRERR